MKTRLFLTIVLVSGFSAGIVHGLINLISVEPFLDSAIGIENQRMFSSGQVLNGPDFWQKFDSYRMWQKEGAILAGGILGLASGALVGLVFAYARKSLPSKNHVKKALTLCIIMWFVLFFLPALKYPPNPPAVGDPNTISFRQTIYAEFVMFSGFAALTFAILSKKLTRHKKMLALIGYTIFMTALFFIMPDNPDHINISLGLVNSFRTISVITVAIWWMVNGVILGILWEKFPPHVPKKQIQQ